MVFQKRYKYAIVILTYLLLIISCTNPFDIKTEQGPQEPIVPGSLIINTYSFQIDADSTKYVIYIKSSNGQALKWKIISYPQWLVPIDTSGTADSIQNGITFMSNLSKVNVGSTSGSIIFRYGDNFTRSVTVYVDKTTLPKNLNFTNMKTNATIYYYWTTTSSNKYLYLQYKSSWFHCKKDTVGKGLYNSNIDTLDLSVDIEGLPNGIYYDTLKLISAVDESIKNIPITLVITNQAKICFADTTLYLDRIQNLAQVIIKNSGNTASTWKISPVNGIHLSKNNGTLSPQQKDSIIVAFDSTIFNNTIVQASLILSHDSITNVLPVIIKNYRDLFNFTEYRIKGAAFSRQKNACLIIDSLNLYITNPDSTNNTEVIALPKIPTCICVSSNGKMAAVGHDGYISLINLDTRSLDATLSVTCYVYDISMGDSIIYVFPLRDDIWALHAFNINTRKEIPTEGYINFTATGKIHPSQKYAYMINHGISPQDMYKIGITGDRVKRFYDSPYHGDYDIGENFWYTEDGDFLISASSNMFRLSEQQSGDMIYAGKLQYDKGILYLTWADHHKKTGYIYCSNSHNTIYKFTDQYFNFSGSYTIPEQQMYYSGKNVNVVVDSRYLFVNNKGNKVYILGTVQSNSNLKWLLGCISTDLFKQ